MVFETGTHCRWMERHIRSLGFRAIVANPAKARISGDPTSKNDWNDARGLARLALADCGVRIGGRRHWLPRDG